MHQRVLGPRRAQFTWNLSRWEEWEREPPPPLSLGWHLNNDCDSTFPLHVLEVEANVTLLDTERGQRSACTLGNNNLPPHCFCPSFLRVAFTISIFKWLLSFLRATTQKILKGPELKGNSLFIHSYLLNPSPPPHVKGFKCNNETKSKIVVLVLVSHMADIVTKWNLKSNVFVSQQENEEE